MSSYTCQDCEKIIIPHKDSLDRHIKAKQCEKDDEFQADGNGICK